LQEDFVALEVKCAKLSGMNPGDKVSVVDAFGKVLKRVVVAVERPNVFICTPEEWQAAKTEKREPTCIGFKNWQVTHGGNR
jgi:anaerobic selenocysteine-containing dehydrogenase